MPNPPTFTIDPHLAKEQKKAIISDGFLLLLPKLGSNQRPSD